MSDKTQGCTEEMQIELSALVDGEVDPTRLLPLIDRLVESEGCRDFYRKSRRLDERIAAAPVAEKLPAGLWNRISQRSGLGERTWKSRWTMPQAIPTWALGAAAVAVLVFALWDAPPVTDPAQTARTRPGVRIALEVGAEPERMNDERFVALITELLQADTKYHRKMLEVMSEVDEFGFDPEGSSEGRGTSDEGSRNEGERSARESSERATSEGR